MIDRTEAIYLTILIAFLVSATAIVAAPIVAQWTPDAAARLAVAGFIGFFSTMFAAIVADSLT